VIEVVTDGVDEYGNSSDGATPWHLISVEIRAAWIEWLENWHSFQVALAESHPDVREAWEAMGCWIAVNEEEWEDQPTLAKGLLKSVAGTKG